MNMILRDCARKTVEMNGITLNALFDTGSDVTAINEKIVEEKKNIIQKRYRAS